MKKRILFLVVLSAVIAWLLLPIFANGDKENNQDIVTIEKTIITVTPTTEEELIDQAITKMQAEMNDIQNIKNEKEWFVAYKELIDKYSDVIDPPENLYDLYSESELDLLFRVVEAEATAGSFKEKANIASVIFNRLSHDGFGDTMDKVLIPSQFSPLMDGRAYQVEITEDTVLACEYAFMIKDTTNGAIYFESKNSNVHAAYAKYLFTDEIGHSFYK